MAKKFKYYSLDKILSANAEYNIIYGERSNGKTTAVLKYALEHFINTNFNKQLSVIRRWEEDFKGNNGKVLFNGVVSLGWVDEYTDGVYNNIIYKNRAWYLAKTENGETDYVLEKPFAIGFAISSEEHYKSTSYPDIDNILFDEFITRSYYLPDEFVKFQNLLSTIIRLRDNVKIFMCGNTINRYCPYFNEMGLTNIKNQSIGSIDVYTYGESGLKVAVEYADGDKKQKKSNKYFAFNNPKLQMITSGGWEIDIYPHLPHKYKPKDIKLVYFIDFDGDVLQCEIIRSNEFKTLFTFIHRKTTPINATAKNIVFSTETKCGNNYRRNIIKPYDSIGKLIYEFYQQDNVYYQSNEIGEIVNNYIKWCESK